ncbi:MAG TPA: response regulator [Bacteroidetes bacterium]|nr:response regulator [Bacteroidota bacterium]
MQKVLVVDDDVQIVKMLTSILSKCGIESYKADNATSALQLLQDENDIDLILSDIYMGEDETSGMEMLRVCRQVYPQIPFILMTGYAEDEIFISALREGAFDFIIKPFDQDKVLDVIERANKLIKGSTENQDLSTFVTEFCLHLSIKAQDFSPSGMQNLVKDVLRNYIGCNQNDETNLLLAVEEAGMNALDHGCLELDSRWKEECIDEATYCTRFDKVKKERLATPEYGGRHIDFDLKYRKPELHIVFHDEGNGFDTSHIRDAATGEVHGMGLMIINNLVDKILFNEKGNEITLIKTVSLRAA